MYGAPICNGRLPFLWRRLVPPSTSSFYFILSGSPFAHIPYFVYLFCIYSPCTLVLFVTPVNEVIFAGPLSCPELFAVSSQRRSITQSYLIDHDLQHKRISPCIIW